MSGLGKDRRHRKLNSYPTKMYLYLTNLVLSDDHEQPVKHQEQVR
jgi:hypothetical protein